MINGALASATTVHIQNGVSALLKADADHWKAASSTRQGKESHDADALRKFSLRFFSAGIVYVQWMRAVL